MLRLTALIHTHNDALRVGRCLETVYPCDEVIVVDHGSTDRTVQIAREYGARVISQAKAASQIDCAGWILCLDPHESLTEGLAASLFEWKLENPPAKLSAISVFLRRETSNGWDEESTAETRIVPCGWNRWRGYLPANEAESRSLEGDLLTFMFP